MKKLLILILSLHLSGCAPALAEGGGFFFSKETSEKFDKSTREWCKENDFLMQVKFEPKLKAQEAYEILCSNN